MQDMDDLKEQLRKAIQSSNEYVEYKRLESIIKRNPDLKRQIDEFRRQNFEIQNSEQCEDILQLTENLNAQYKDMRSQDTVNRYLNAEVCLCRLLQDLCFTVVDAVDFELDFLR
ncbi:MAG: YlbF family regulator [Eubacteriales bacterium]|nr:YlbF family regulator [Eubacteriales bacterium]